MRILILKSVNEKIEELSALLVDCVESGASVGFIPPFNQSEAHRYWQTVDADIQSGSRLLMIALRNNLVAGTVQLSLCMKMGCTELRLKN